MDAFEEMYAVNRQVIFNYFLRMAGNPHLAEELTQDTFLRAFRFSSGFRGDAATRTWLVRIAINVWDSYSKKHKIQTPVNLDTENIPDTQDYANSSTQRMQIDQVFNMLDEKERTIIMLRDINGFSYEEMAVVLGINVGQVRVGLHRARKKFRKLYQDLEKEGNK